MRGRGAEQIWATRACYALHPSRRRIHRSNGRLGHHPENGQLLHSSTPTTISEITARLAATARVRAVHRWILAAIYHPRRGRRGRSGIAFGSPTLRDSGDQRVGWWIYVALLYLQPEPSKHL